jgi:hypothetical protein
MLTFLRRSTLHIKRKINFFINCCSFLPLSNNNKECTTNIGTNFSRQGLSKEEKEENYQKDVERERVEKLQRENDEMKQQLAQLSPSSTLQVNLQKKKEQR